MGDYSLIEREHLEDMLRETNRDNALLDEQLINCEQKLANIASNARDSYQRLRDKGLIEDLSQIGSGGFKTRRKRRRRKRKTRRKKKRKTRRKLRKKKRKTKKRRRRKKKGGVYTEKFYDSDRYKHQFLKLYKNRTPIVVGEGVFDSFANRNSDGKRIIKIDITPDGMRPTLKQFLLEDFDNIIIDHSQERGRIGS